MQVFSKSYLENLFTLLDIALIEQEFGITCTAGKGGHSITPKIRPIDLAKLNFQRSTELFQNEDIPQLHDDFGENAEKIDPIKIATNFIEHSRINGDDNNQSELFSKISQKFDFESRNNSHFVAGSHSHSKLGKYMIADDIADDF